MLYAAARIGLLSVVDCFARYGVNVNTPGYVCAYPIVAWRFVVSHLASLINAAPAILFVLGRMV